MSSDMLLNSKMQFFRWPNRADQLWDQINSIFINIPLHEGKKERLKQQRLMQVIRGFKPNRYPNIKFPFTIQALI